MVFNILSSLQEHMCSYF